MVWTFDDLDIWYIQCSRNENKSFPVYKLNNFQRDTNNCCIWISISYNKEWYQYNSLYFSNGIIGVYDPSNIFYGDLLRIEFEDPLDVLTIECGLCFSFLNQFDLGIENEEVIAGIKKIAKIKH